MTSDQSPVTSGQAPRHAAITPASGAAVCSLQSAVSPRLVDAHVHLQDYEAGTDVQAIVDQSLGAGVTHLVCNGTEESDWEAVSEIARRNPCVIPFFGVHPWFVDRCSDDWLANLESILRRVPSGIGEIGIDRNIEGFDKDRQECFFREQLRLALRLDRPATIHCVRSWGWLMEILRSEPQLPSGMLIHAYGGSADLIRPLAEAGMFFSFSGKVLYNNYGRARRSLLEIPLDRLLIETDAPNMLPPEGYRTFAVPTSDGGEYNHPGNLPAILAGIAELLDQPVDQLRETLWENSKRFLARVSSVG